MMSSMCCFQEIGIQLCTAPSPVYYTVLKQSTKHEMLMHRAIITKEENKLPNSRCLEEGLIRQCMRMPAIRPDITHSHQLSWDKRNGRAIDADAAIVAAAVIDELLFNQG